MTFWIVLLRAVGTVILVLGVGVGTINSLSLQVAEDFWWTLYHVWLPVLQNLVFGLLCFGVAAGLKTVQRTDERIVRATARRRRAVQHGGQAYSPATTIPTPPASPNYYNPPQNVAPDAPNWTELPAPPALGSGAEKRIAQKRRKGTDQVADLYDDYYNRRPVRDRPIPQPSTIRDAPPPVRITPGTEDQYGADTQQLQPLHPQRTPPPPSHVNAEADRDILKQGRDSLLRRLQAERSRRHKPQR